MNCLPPERAYELYIWFIRENDWFRYRSPEVIAEDARLLLRLWSAAHPQLRLPFTAREPKDRRPKLCA
jgi:hypothetical protein